MEGLIVLHGAPRPSGFALWAEGVFVPHDGRDRHPRALEPKELLDALSAEGLASPVSARTETALLTLVVPAVHGRPVPSAPALREPADYAPPCSAALRIYEVPAFVLPVAAALETLLALPAALRARPLPVSAGDDLDYWAEVARWVFDLLLRRRVAPGTDGTHPRWRPVLDDPHERERLRRLAEAMPPVSRAILPPGVRLGPDGALPPARGLLLAFLDEAVDAAARDVLRDVLPAERRRAGDSPEAEVVAALAAPPTRALEPGVLSRLTEWSLPLLDPLPESLLRLGIRVVPPPEAGGPFSLAYVLESGESPEVSLPAEEIWATTDGSMRRRGRLFTNPQDTLLARLGTAAALSRPVARSLEERHPTGVILSPDEAWRFLSDEAPLLGEAGIAVRLPGGGSLARVALKLVARAPGAGEADASVVRFGLDALVDFDWRVAVGDALLSPHEFEELAARQIPLVEIRGEWVLLDKENLEKARRLLEILLVEENPLPPDLDEGNLPGGQLLDLVGGEERIAHGHAPIEVDEGVETEAHDGRVGFARSGRARHELERDAREAAAAGQADGDAGLPEKRGLVGQKAPRFVRRQDDARGMPLLETPRDGTRERRGRSEPREKRVLRVREQAPAPPHRAIRRGPDLLGRERDLGAFSGLEDVRERKRAAGLGWRHDADSEAQQALGQGIQKREAPLGQARKDAGLERTGRRSGERGDDLGLGRVARAAPLGRKDVPEDVARRRVHGLVEELSLIHISE